MKLFAEISRVPLVQKSGLGSGGYAYANKEDLSAANLGSTTLTLGYDGNGHLNQTVLNGTTLSATADSNGNDNLLFGQVYTYSPRNLLATGDEITYEYNGFAQRVLSKTSAAAQASLYDDFGHLEGESSPSASTVNYDYIWFNGEPVAQETLGSSPSTVYTHTNELGEPFLQTSTTGAVTWQADYAPYGNIYSLRHGSLTAHQPLRLPGQEAELLPGFQGPSGSDVDAVPWTDFSLTSGRVVHAALEVRG